MRFDAARGQLSVEFYSRFVESDFDHRKVRSRRFKIFAQRQAREFVLRGGKLVEVPAEVNYDQVALMPELREQRALAVLAALHRGHRRRAALEDRRAALVG